MIEVVNLIYKRLPGRLEFGLFTEDGKLLANIMKTQLISPAGDHPRLHVEIGLFSDRVLVAGDLEALTLEEVAGAAGTVADDAVPEPAQQYKPKYL